MHKLKTTMENIVSSAPNSGKDIYHSASPAPTPKRPKWLRNAEAEDAALAAEIAALESKLPDAQYGSTQSNLTVAETRRLIDIVKQLSGGKAPAPAPAGLPTPYTTMAEVDNLAGWGNDAFVRLPRRDYDRLLATARAGLDAQGDAVTDETLREISDCLFSEAANLEDYGNEANALTHRVLRASVQRLRAYATTLRFDASRSERPTGDAPSALREDVTNEEVEAALAIWFPHGRYAVVEPVYRDFMRDLLTAFVAKRSGQVHEDVSKAAADLEEIVALFPGAGDGAGLREAVLDEEDGIRLWQIAQLLRRLAAPSPPSPAPARESSPCAHERVRDLNRRDVQCIACGRIMDGASFYGVTENDPGDSNMGAGGNVWGDR
jgi:hypothetical protein